MYKIYDETLNRLDSFVHPEKGFLPWTTIRRNTLPITRADPRLPSATPQGHHREVWCLTISPSGDHIVSSSHDKSLRLWERTREPIILEEEREMVRMSAGRMRRHSTGSSFFKSCQHIV